MPQKTEAPRVPQLQDELWELVIAIDDEVAVRCYALNRRLHAIADHSLLSRKVLPPRLRRTKEKRTCVMKDLCEALALPPYIVRPKRVARVARRGGGHYNVFLASLAVDELLEENGGLLGLKNRIAARRELITTFFRVKNE